VKKSFKSPSLQIRVPEGKVWSVYSESDNEFQRYGHLKFSKMATVGHLGFDPTGNGAVGSAVHEIPTLEPNTKGIG